MWAFLFAAMMLGGGVWAFCHSDEDGEGPAEGVSNDPPLYQTVHGEVEDMYRDEDAGVTVVFMTLDNGEEFVGYSRSDVKELESLFAGRGRVSIPLIAAGGGRRQSPADGT